MCMCAAAARQKLACKLWLLLLCLCIVTAEHLPGAAALANVEPVFCYPAAAAPICNLWVFIMLASCCLLVLLLLFLV